MIHARQEYISAAYNRDGVVFPLDILTPEEAKEVRHRFDEIEASVGKRASQTGLQHLHRTEPMVWRLVTHPNILAFVAAVLGDDLLLLGSHFFCKQPEFSSNFVAWHQDVTYWGLQPARALTVWLAIDDADEANGCMRVVPGSHRAGQLPHTQSERVGNLLSINQAIAPEGVDEKQAICVELRAGQASIHDGLLVHGSMPNLSQRRRCGLTMRFTTPEVRPMRDDPNAVNWKPLLISGEDRYGHFELDTPPHRGPAAGVGR